MHILTYRNIISNLIYEFKIWACDPLKRSRGEAFFSSSVETQPVRASNSRHMEAHWLPATQSGLHYLAHTGIIKKLDQRADYFSTAELQDSLLFVLPFFLFVVFDSLFLSFFHFRKKWPGITLLFWKQARHGSCTASISVDTMKVCMSTNSSTKQIWIDK